MKQRPDRLVQKVFNDTVHHFYDEYRRILGPRESRRFSADPEEIEVPRWRAPRTAPLPLFELREAQELEIRRLREHLEAGRITEADFLLLVGTRVYGKPVADYAREMGLDYQVGKKRRQRAEAAIRAFEERNQEISKNRVPFFGAQPAFIP